MKKNIWNKFNAEELEKMEELTEAYRCFLDNGKTERECVSAMILAAEKAGYRKIEDYLKKGEALKPGDKIYAAHMNKLLLMFEIGEKPITEGMNIIGAHIDSPHVDLKQNPLYEKDDLAYFDTHYYGGIKKYQWVTTPMALHGIVAKKDGTVLDIRLGDELSEPAFVFTDLLPHLAQKQMKEAGSEVVTGENLDLLIGSKPIKKEEEKDAVKAAILDLLKEKYDIEEEDFLSAEIQIVPAEKARVSGLDRSMILSYGQDDRVCAFTSFTALLETHAPKKTVCCMFVDKEEIGSVGATSMSSYFFENTVSELVALNGGSALDCRRLLHRSAMLSADVSAAYDPLYGEVYDKNSACTLGAGLCFNKFTGARGKSQSNDANAEYIAKLRRVFDEKEVSYQFSEMGKVDQGGGGTIAYIPAVFGMDVIDCGVPILNMHAPYEISSKADVYEAYKGYKIFLSDF